MIDLRDDLPDEWKAFVQGIPTPGMLADLVASNLALPPEERIRLLEETDPIVRLLRIEEHLEREVTIAETQQALRDESNAEEMDPKRRERMLRRRMREIQDEIGEADAGLREVDELREKLEAANLPEEPHAQAERELKRLSALPQHAPDRHLIRTYLEWMVDLPWSVETEDKLDLAHARAVLDADHHGLDKVKERILEFLAVRKLAPQAKAPDPVLRRTAGRRQDVAGPLDRARHGPQVRARLPRRRARRGRDPRAPTHLRRRHARAHPAEPEARGLAQPGLPARRDRQARIGLPRATRRRRCSRCSIPSRTTPSATTTSRCPSTSRRCCSSPPPIPWRRFRRRCSTAWR